ncbi:MAG TPA: DNA primase [Alphaproteobacteria bacterium]|nr:DNA primase [Alphaproteobacteria bacterium]
MALPPAFLDELRQRLPCSEVIAKRVRLVKRGREYLGLCPFHNEKTPSFTVNDDKGFFHCFGCGAHGDVIGFAMRAESLSFPEAVEKLAGMAGLQVPRLSPVEAEHELRRQSLYDVVEAACRWFEDNLRSNIGRSGLDYLRRRGLDDATIKRFRLGYAPDARGALKAALRAKNIDEARLLEAGLLVSPEGGGESFDFFRGRVIFPILDRQGRPIAFGGRIIGEGQPTPDGRGDGGAKLRTNTAPKYLNSRDTPLFDKGRTLYALDKAREGVRNGAKLVVAEGYMDVIALHAAGFNGAVAPLGTALTEAQIETLWKLTPEPILCFDGDAAGQRAALRAAERALPLLKPGCSLQFATLPPGEDPDSLLKRRGPAAVAEVLSRTKPLVDVEWESLVATTPAETPEQRALLERRLEDVAARIAERTVQWQYRRLFRLRVRARFFPTDGRRRPEAAMKAPGHAWVLDRVPETVLLATLLNHVDLIAWRETLDELERIEFVDDRLSRLKADLFDLGASIAELPRQSLVEMLTTRGHGETIAQLNAPDVFVHARFAHPEASTDEAAQGWRAYFRGLYLRRLRSELEAARSTWVAEPNEENLHRIEELGRMLAAESEQAAQSDLSEVPAA